MSLSLRKGGAISLSKEAPGLKKVLVGLGWQENSAGGLDFDLDASAFMLTGPKVRDDSRFVFYGQRVSSCSSVLHHGDNQTGATDQGETDSEVVEVDLTAVPGDVDRIVFVVTIHEAEQRRQNFGQVEDAYIRVVSAENSREILRFDLTERFSSETAVEFGEVYREGADWKFRALAAGASGGLHAMCKRFGVNVD